MTSPLHKLRPPRIACTAGGTGSDGFIGAQLLFRTFYLTCSGAWMKAPGYPSLTRAGRNLLRSAVLAVLSQSFKCHSIVQPSVSGCLAMHELRHDNGDQGGSIACRTLTRHWESRGTVVGKRSWRPSGTRSGLRTRTEAGTSKHSSSSVLLIRRFCASSARPREAQSRAEPIASLARPQGQRPMRHVFPNIRAGPITKSGGRRHLRRTGRQT